MDKIKSVHAMSEEPEQSYSNSRRETRKRLEKGIADNSPDRLILHNIMLAIMVIIASVVSFTDFRISLGKIQQLTTLAVFLYIITSLVYQNRYNRGKIRGKMDSEYKDSLREYRQKRQTIYDNSVAGLVPEFCRSYKIKELQEYRTSLLSDVEIEYSEYKEKYRRLPFLDVLRLRLPWDLKKTIIKCNRAKPIRLAAGLILNENGEMDREKLIGQSGREREKRDKRKQLINRAITVLFGAAVVVNIISDFSVITIIQWAVRMLPIIAAIPMGDDSGYCNITVTETTFKRDQVSVINLFNEYVKEKKQFVQSTAEDNEDVSEHEAEPAEEYVPIQKSTA